jgi:hypothetical protein
MLERFPIPGIWIFSFIGFLDANPYSLHLKMLYGIFRGSGDLSAFSRDGKLVELCLDPTQKDANILGFGTLGRHGEDLL